jgi:hypothetical protein
VFNFKGRLLNNLSKLAVIFASLVAGLVGISQLMSGGCSLQRPNDSADGTLPQRQPSAPSAPGPRDESNSVGTQPPAVTINAPSSTNGVAVGDNNGTINIGGASELRALALSERTAATDGLEQYRKMLNELSRGYTDPTDGAMQRGEEAYAASRFEEAYEHFSAANSRIRDATRLLRESDSNGKIVNMAESLRVQVTSSRDLCIRYGYNTKLPSQWADAERELARGDELLKAGKGNDALAAFTSALQMYATLHTKR